MGAGGLSEDDAMDTPPLDLRAPLIVIGAGRSGTTLLMRALRAHPQMSFHGENDFLAPRLWAETAQNRFWHNWERQLALSPTSSAAPLPPLDPRARDGLEAQAGALVADHMARLLDVRSQARAWGYKELWNGSAWSDRDWAVYDAIFPRARWLHLARNPFAFAASVARWNVRPLTQAHLRELLLAWTRIQAKSRERWETGRYIRLRYEDMVADPRASLTPVLDGMGLTWVEACAEVFSAKVLESVKSPFATLHRRTVRASDYARLVPGFLGQCEDLGYLDPFPLVLQEDSTDVPATPDLRVQ